MSGRHQQFASVCCGEQEMTGVAEANEQLTEIQQDITSLYRCGIKEDR